MKELLHYIVVIIPKFDFYKIVFEDEFINDNQFRTQNEIIEVLKTLGLDRKEFICDLYTKEKENKNEKI